MEGNAVAADDPDLGIVDDLDAGESKRGGADGGGVGEDLAGVVVAAQEDDRRFG